jgi:hypothetical protein
MDYHINPVMQFVEMKAHESFSAVSNKSTTILSPDAHQSATQYEDNRKKESATNVTHSEPSSAGQGYPK